MRKHLASLLLASLTLIAGCQKAELSEAEKKTVISMALSSVPPLPPDPTNRHADQADAAAFGATLFFEKRLSINGKVSCSSCHISDQQFQDDRPFGLGIGQTRRRTMPLADVSYSPWFFWDGRKDSQWAQALGPLEDLKEHGGTRTAYARFIAQELKERYERIFGPLPDMSQLPETAGPLGTDVDRQAWAAMTNEQRKGVNIVFANMGKAIAAFERTIRHKPTRFDKFAEAIAAGREPEDEAALTSQEVTGLKLFIGEAGCSTCHTGPRFTDDYFHNTGIPPVKGKPADMGRMEGVAAVLADPFNCLGAYRDGDESACKELRFMVKKNPELFRAFKTPSLRGAATRPPYMHGGQFKTLEEVVDHYNRAPKAVTSQSELRPLGLSSSQKAALVAFLKALTELPPAKD